MSTELLGAILKMKGFYQTYIDLFESIDELIGKRRIVPVLILIYTGIDSFSWLADNNRNDKRTRFKEWVKNWMLEKYPLPCNEKDIYSARNGLLHKQTSESEMTQNSKARQILYSWGKADISILEKTIKNSGKENQCIAVKLEDLYWSFRKGMSDCYAEISKDENWKKSFEIKAEKLFVSVNS